MARASGTDLAMDLLVTLDEMEAKIQEAVFKTEEEIMGCPLLQKAMAKVEEEALNFADFLSLFDLSTKRI